MSLAPLSWFVLLSLVGPCLWLLRYVESLAKPGGDWLCS